MAIVCQSHRQFWNGGPGCNFVFFFLKHRGAPRIFHSAPREVRMTDELPLPGGVTTEAIADAVDEILRTSNWDEVTIKLVLAKLEKILLPAGSAGMLKPHKKAIKLEVDTAMQRIIDERALASVGLDTDALVQPPAEEALSAAPRGDSAKRAREEEAGKGEAGGRRTKKKSAELQSTHQNKICVRSKIDKTVRKCRVQVSGKVGGRSPPT